VTRFVVVTGTSTAVGKTVATAALAATTPGALVVKPVQTGAADGDSDAGEVHRLTGADVEEWTTLDEPLAPDTAARRQGVEIPTVGAYAARLLALTADTVVVEGAGGLLVRLDADGGTLLDLTALLAAAGVDVEVVVVVAAGLGTLNHTELTVDALRRSDVPVRGLVVGAWPDSPGLAERCNLDDLQRVAPLLAVLPDGAGRLDREAFVAAAPGWFSAGGAPRRRGSS
jgi:dethiobiotin synthetase